MSGALVLANLRYWRAIAPIANAQLRYWASRAERIPNPVLRKIALDNLREEGFNAQATATLATLAPPDHRLAVVEAIVGLQVTYDYLDSLVEQPHPDPLLNGRRLYRAFVDAVAVEREPSANYYDQALASGDNGYLDELIANVRLALKQLPSRAATKQVSIQAAERCAEAQVRAHATDVTGDGQLQSWASDAGQHLGHDWREFLAGAVSSGLALHALATHTAIPLTTERHAQQLDSAYLSLCAITTLLDGLVDYEQDIDAMDQAGYVRYYDNDRDLLSALKGLVQRAIDEMTVLPWGAHHLMTLYGVISYYLSAPSATHSFSDHVTKELRRAVGPALAPPLTIMRAWRLVKR